MPILSADILVVILVAIAIVSCFLYLHEYFLRKKISVYQKKFSEEDRQKTMQLLRAAEAAESQLLAEGNFISKKLEAQFQSQLENLIKSSENSISDSQNKLLSFMENLRKVSEESAESSKKASEQRINTLFERLEGQLSEFLITSEQKTTSSIELELKATRELIETYKAAQLKLIDENIIAMMEQTLNIVLGKKLTLKDQVELIYEALERAKVDKFII